MVDSPPPSSPGSIISQVTLVANIVKSAGRQTDPFYQFCF